MSIRELNEVLEAVTVPLKRSPLMSPRDISVAKERLKKVLDKRGGYMKGDKNWILGFNKYTRLLDERPGVTPSVSLAWAYVLADAGMNDVADTALTKFLQRFGTKVKDPTVIGIYNQIQKDRSVPSMYRKFLFNVYKLVKENPKDYSPLIQRG